MINNAEQQSQLNAVEKTFKYKIKRTQFITPNTVILLSKHLRLKLFFLS